MVTIRNIAAAGRLGRGSLNGASAQQFISTGGPGVVGGPDLGGQPSAAALSLAATGSGAFAHFETHELIEASDLTAIAERAKGITYRPPGA
jgi:hypothetical protein